MKKRIVYSLVALSAFLSSAVSFAYETKADDYQIIPEENLTVKNITEYIDESKMQPINESQTEFIYKLNDKTGYLDKKTEFGFITEYDSITSLDKLLKVSNDGKYGVIDKQGNIILSPQFQKINLLTSDGNEYIEAKLNGKYKMYYTSGKLIPLNELMNITGNTTILLAKDLKPEIKEYSFGKFEETKTNIAVEPKENENISYEITEIPVSGKNNIIDSAKDIVEYEATTVIEPAVAEEKNIFNIVDKQFYFINENGKTGVLDHNKQVVVPAQYDKIAIKLPCAHYVNPVFVVYRNNLYGVLDINGNILADQTDEELFIYKNNDVYSYRLDGTGKLTKNGEEIGTLTKTNDKYKYTANKFLALKPHCVINLIKTILNVANL